MIVVCERLPSGEVKKYRYPESVPGPGDEAIIPVLPLEWALPIARQIVQQFRHPCWIEQDSQPASRPTIEKAEEWRLRWLPPEGTKH
jgi:hypothetical protein